MSWAQKEFLAGELWRGFCEVAKILQNETFECQAERHDVTAFRSVVGNLCRGVSGSCIEVRPPDVFAWRQGEGQSLVYCLCKRTQAGWMLEIGGPLNVWTHVCRY